MRIEITLKSRAEYINVIAAAQRAAHPSELKLDRDYLISKEKGGQIKLIFLNLSPDKPQEKAIIAAIYARVEELNEGKEGKEITINPSDKGFQSDAEIRREKIRVFSIEYPYRLFIRADKFKSVMEHRLPDVKKTPAEHMRIHDTPRDGERGSGYLSLFEVENTMTVAYKKTRELPGDYIHLLFVPKGSIAEVSLGNATAQMQHGTEREPLFLETSGVQKLFVMTVPKDGEGELIPDTSGRRSINIHEHLFCGNWPLGMVEISIPTSSRQKLDEIFSDREGKREPGELYFLVSEAIENGALRFSYVGPSSVLPEIEQEGQRRKIPNVEGVQPPEKRKREEEGELLEQPVTAAAAAAPPTVQPSGDDTSARRLDSWRRQPPEKQQHVSQKQPDAASSLSATAAKPQQDDKKPTTPAPSM